MPLSVCLIVKDEEATLGRCLASLRPVCDEMIVVDTGSRDGTRALAAAAGARVFDFAWTQDFSAARNFSLAQATQPWILVCDADEALDAADYAELERMLAAPQADGYELIIRNYFTGPSFSVMEKMAVPNTAAYRTGREYPYYVDHPLLRLFRNDARIRFSGRIHETVGGAFGPHGLRVARSALVLHHFGKIYLDREEKKRELYLQLAEQKLRESPTDVKSQFDYAIQLFVARRFEECITILQSMLRERPLMNEMVYVYLSRAYQFVQRSEEAFWAAQQALQINAHNPLTYYIAGEALQGLERMAEAREAYQRAVELAPHLPEPYIGLSNLAWATGQRVESINFLHQGVARDPDNRVLLELAAARLISCNQYEAALPYCHRLIEQHPNAEAERWFIFLTLYYQQTNQGEKAIQVLQRGLARYPGHPRLCALQAHILPFAGTGKISAFPRTRQL